MTFITMQSIYDFIATQPEIMINKVYGSSDVDNNYSPWACKAIFSSLSSLSKNYIFRNLFILEPLNVSELEKWVKPELKHLHLSAIDELMKLRILIEYNPSNNDNTLSSSRYKQKLQMNSYFRKGFQYALCNPIEPWSNSPYSLQLRTDKKAPSKNDLDKFSMDKWNNVLRYLLNVQLPSSVVSNDSIIITFLKKAGLVVENNKRSFEITSSGYEYMLKDHQSQVWIFVLESLSRRQYQEEALILFFLLSDCTFGNCYPIEALTKNQKQLMYELSKIGLIYIRDILSTRFYPTRSAINMLFKSTPTGDLKSTQESYQTDSDINGSINNQCNIPVSMNKNDSADILQIIVETNLQVIAYVTSDLHLAMLKLFVDLSIRMPNMAIGKITRERSREAFRMGIRAHQIIEFLRSHAHPTVLSRESTVPGNVSDQLLLWEAERFRIQADETVLLDFTNIRGINNSIFKDIFTYAKKLKVCLWVNEKDMLICVIPEGQEHVQSYAEDLLNIKN